jgi:hypothetical protein
MLSTMLHALHTSAPFLIWLVLMVLVFVGAYIAVNADERGKW